MKNKLRIKIMKETTNAKNLRDVSKMSDNFELKEELNKKDKYVKFLINLEKNLNKN